MHPQPPRSVPRTRGDGPRTGPASSTDQPLFPAHAGMARNHPDASRAPTSCSPHTRGWPGPGSPGSSACSPVPRTRGDGPSRGRVMSGWLTCSPHTRGWPGSASLAAGRPGAVPRTRGDGPVPRYPLGSHLGTCSPHTRGWPRKHQAPQSRGGLFPAHAGMARCRFCPGHGAGPCSPHTRGWPGGATVREKRRQNCSPHTRGWPVPTAPPTGCGLEPADCLAAILYRP